MGRFWRSLKLGFKSLMLHKLRSGLTVLGVVFGVMSVISMLAIGEGTSRDAQRRYELLGATNLIYRSVKPTDEQQASGGRPARILNYGLKYRDYDRILETVPTLRKVLPIREIRKEIRHLGNSLDGRVVGTTHDYDEFNHLDLEQGRFLSEADNANYKNYAVLAAETAATLFPIENPIGKSIKIGFDYYVVIGVMRSRASSAGIGGSLAAQDYNKDVYIPLNTCRLRFGERIVNFRSGAFDAEETQLTQITVQVGDTDEVRPTALVLQDAVEPFHDKDDVELTVPYDLLEEKKRTARQFTIILGSIAGISLLVGGIGIMNIMLATVTERTREIGIRRALGAKQRDIIQQFLIETVALSSIGGLLGVFLGVAFPFVVVYFIPETKVFVTAASIILAFGISVLVGILAGLYPAYRAARMDPIEALRHE